MAGVKGAGGPVPKRSDQRRGRNKRAIELKTARAGERAPAPDPDESWHPVALRWYRSLEESGQSVFYEASDWATAFLVAEALSRALSPQVVGVTETGEPVREVVPIQAATLSALVRMMGSLLTTEGDRRRVAVELTRTEDATPAPVSNLEEYRLRLEGPTKQGETDD